MRTPPRSRAPGTILPSVASANQLVNSRFVCARCSELDLGRLVEKFAERLGRDHRPNCIGASPEELATFLQRILFDTSVPFLEQCGPCQVLSRASQHVFTFPCPLQQDGTAKLDTTILNPTKSWFEFARNRDVIEHHSSEPTGEGCTRIAGRGAPVGYYIGDNFGIASNKSPTPDDPSCKFCFRVVNPARPDYEFIGSWLDECVRSHPECRASQSSSLSSIRLVDVESREVIPYPSGPPPVYMALSYVWGNTPQQGFGLGPLTEKLPRTIEDAITVVKALGKRYLWVDFVCIDQNDNANKMSQINIMDEIYTGAFATIISLNGSSADEGLPRVGDSAPMIPQPVLDCGNGNKLVSSMGTLEDQRARGAWSERGWTFQEGVLSKRHLYFSRQQVYFACGKMARQESLHDCLPPVPRTGTRRRRGADMSRENDLSSSQLLHMNLEEGWNLYTGLLRGFFGRTFTRRSDIINAFTGILTRLTRATFHDGFILGLPRAHLRHALLWEPDFSNPPYDYSWPGQQRIPSFPSWAWAGWEWDYFPPHWNLSQPPSEATCRGRGLPPKFWDWQETEIPQQSETPEEANERASWTGKSALSSLLSEIDARTYPELDVMPEDVLFVEGIVLEIKLEVYMRKVLQHSFIGAHHVNTVDSPALILVSDIAHLEHDHFDIFLGEIFEIGVPRVCRGILLSVQSREGSHGSEGIEDDTEGESATKVSKGHWRLNLLLFEGADDIVHRVGICTIQISKKDCREFFGQSKARLEKIALQ